MKKLTREEMAMVYAFAISQPSGAFNWKVYNDQIKKHWKESGFLWIKKRAWQIIDAVKYDNERFIQMNKSEELS